MMPTHLRCFLGTLLAASLWGLAPGRLSAEEPAPAPAAGDAQQALEQQAAADRKLQEEVQVQAQSHLLAGKKLFEAFEFEAARAELEKAVILDRSNAEAQKELLKVNDVLGRRRDHIKSAAEQLYGESKIAVQERLAELDNRIDWANKFVAQARGEQDLPLAERVRKYEQALQAFERAHEIVKWMPPQVNVDEQNNLVSRMVREVRRSIKATEEDLATSDRASAQALAEQRREEERRFVQKKLAVQIDQARALFETGRYDEAENLAGKILEQDPSNVEAHVIEATARGRRHATTRAWIDEEFKENFLRQIERADRMTVPHGGYLIYPDNWRSEISQRSGDSPRRTSEEPWKQEARKKLSRRVSFEFVDTPLEEALAFMGSLTKATFILDPRAAAEGAGKVAITLKVADMEMETALKWILRLADLDYELRNQAVFITKKANLAASVELEIYDVRDLTTTLTDFPGPRIELGVAAQGAGAGGNPFGQANATPNLAPADLAALIKDRLLPKEFTDPATSIEESGGKLVVMQRTEIHDKIRHLLKSFRESQTVQVTTQVRYIDVEEGFLEQIGVHFMGLDAPPGQDYDPFAAGLQGLPNAIRNGNPLLQPSRVGLFPNGGGPGIQSSTPPGFTATALPRDIDSSTPWQWQGFVNGPNGMTTTNAYGIPNVSTIGWAQTYFTPPAIPFFTNRTPQPPLLLRPRLDPNFFGGTVASAAAFSPANAPAGFRRQFWGPSTLGQAITQNFVRNLGGQGALSSALTGTNLGLQGALVQLRFFNNSQASAVVQALHKDQSSDQLLAPRLTQFNNQRAHVLIAQQRSYISDYDVSGAVYDPVVRSFLVGVVLDLRPTVSFDRKYVTMDVRTGTAIELNTTTQFIINLAIPIVLPIELPEIELRSISTTVTIPDTGTLLFSGLVNDRKISSKSGIPFFSDLPVIGRIFSTNIKHRERRNLLVFISPRVILFDEEEAKL